MARLGTLAAAATILLALHCCCRSASAGTADAAAYTKTAGCCRTVDHGIGTYIKVNVATPVACMNLCSAGLDTCVGVEHDSEGGCELHSVAVPHTSLDGFCTTGNVACYARLAQPTAAAAAATAAAAGPAAASTSATSSAARSPAAAATAAAAGRTTVSPVDLCVLPSVPEIEWELCAEEHGDKPCECQGFVKYGAPKHWGCALEVAGTIECSNDAFGGDPHPSNLKMCFCTTAAQPTAAAAAATAAAAGPAAAAASTSATSSAGGAPPAAAATAAAAGPPACPAQQLRTTKRTCKEGMGGWGGSDGGKGYCHGGGITWADSFAVHLPGHGKVRTTETVHPSPTPPRPWSPVVWAGLAQPAAPKRAPRLAHRSVGCHHQRCRRSRLHGPCARSEQQARADAHACLCTVTRDPTQ